MNHDYEKQLEAEIERHFRDLPELPAPACLVSQVMMELDRRAALPWYRQSWERWPMAARLSLVLVLAAIFGAVCYGSWELIHGRTFAALSQQMTGWFSPVTALWNAVSALVNALGLVIKKLGTGFIVGSLAALALGYGMCVGLGTVYIRLGMARR